MCMSLEDGNDVAPRGALLRRAHELLKSAGRPVSETALLEHLYGVHSETGNQALWLTLLRQLLKSSPLFESIESQSWSLTSWRVTNRSLDEIDFVVIDTETTGARPGPDRVIELAGVHVRGGQLLESFQSLIHPRRSLPSFIVQFTGIQPEMLTDAPPAEEVLPAFLTFIEGSILVGHNISFDLSFLSYEAQLAGYGFPLEGLDTIMLARRLVPDLRRFKLDLVANHLGISVVDRHRALGDATVTAEVFVEMLTRARAQGIETLGHLQRRLQLPVAWSGDIKGQLRGKKQDLVRADGKLGSQSYAPSRPTGSLFLNQAWRRDFPNEPGVYLMKDEHSQVLYVGKAKCLKERLASYYHQPLGYTRKMDNLLPNVKEIETRVLGSELEALLVESQLIKQLQPPYNTLLRDYDEYPFIKVDVQHAFPRVYATREVAADGARYFGPFRSRRLVQITLELIEKLFPVRTCTRALPPAADPSTPCLRYHLKRCSAPCLGDADQQSYHAMIEQVCAFLGGERGDLLDRLRQQMQIAAEHLNFERAAAIRDTLRSVDEVLVGQQLMSGAVEANNLLIVYPSARAGYNELFLIRHGRLVDQRAVVQEQQAFEGVALNLLEKAAHLGTPPSIVGKAEVDQITIISRWIHRHSEEYGRAFFPFSQALAADEARHFTSSLWQKVARAQSSFADPCLQDRREP